MQNVLRFIVLGAVTASVVSWDSDNSAFNVVNNDIQPNQIIATKELIVTKNLSSKAAQVLSKLRQDLDDPRKSVPERLVLILGFLLWDIWSNLQEQSTAREIRLSSFGKVGDVLNNSLNVFLNSLTTWLYHDASPDCGRRLLCEAQQEAQSKGLLYTAMNYVSSFAVSLAMKEQKLKEGIAAMRSGREGLPCRSIYPKCPISL